MGNSLSINFRTNGEVRDALNRGDGEALRQVIQQNPKFVTTQAGKAAARLAIAKGDYTGLRILLTAYGEVTNAAKLREFVNDGARSGKSLLMLLATVRGEFTPESIRQQAECIRFLLSAGASPFSRSARGESCIHLAARNDNSGCLQVLLAAHVICVHGSGRLAALVLPSQGREPARFIDLLSNDGLSPLMLAAKKGSHNTMGVLLRHGARLDVVIQKPHGPHRPRRPCPAWLAAGSNALHIAAGTSHAACVSLLLEAQANSPDVSLEGMRNSRGLSPADVINARQIDAMRRIFHEQGHVTRVQLRERRAPHTRSLSERRFVDPDILLASLVKRASLILALRTIGLAQSREAAKEAGSTPLHDSAGEDMPTVVGNVAMIWSHIGAPAADLRTSLKTCLALLNGSLDLPSVTPSGPTPTPPPGAEGEMSEDAKEAAQKLGRTSFAAAALVQAGLNAMATATPAHAPVDQPLSELTPTTALAAAMVLQAVVRTLSATPGEVLQAVSAFASNREGLSRRTLAGVAAPRPSTAQRAQRGEDDTWTSAGMGDVSAQMQRALSAPTMRQHSSSAFRSRAVTELRRSVIGATLATSAGAASEAEGRAPQLGEGRSRRRHIPAASSGMEASSSLPLDEALRFPERARPPLTHLSATSSGTDLRLRPPSTLNPVSQLSATSSGSEWLQRASATRLDLSRSSSGAPAHTASSIAGSSSGGRASQALRAHSLHGLLEDTDAFFESATLSSIDSSDLTLPDIPGSPPACEVSTPSPEGGAEDADDARPRDAPLRTTSADQWLRRSSTGVRIDLVPPSPKSAAADRLPVETSTAPTLPLRVSAESGQTASSCVPTEICKSGGILASRRPAEMGKTAEQGETRSWRPPAETGETAELAERANGLPTAETEEMAETPTFCLPAGSGEAAAAASSSASTSRGGFAAGATRVVLPPPLGGCAPARGSAAPDEQRGCGGGTYCRDVPAGGGEQTAASDENAERGSPYCPPACGNTAILGNTDRRHDVPPGGDEQAAASKGEAEREKSGRGERGGEACSGVVAGGGERWGDYTGFDDDGGSGLARDGDPGRDWRGPRAMPLRSPFAEEPDQDTARGGGEWQVEAGGPSEVGAGGQQSGVSCAICFDAPLEVTIAACGHELCIACAYQMCARGLAPPVCPFCRGPIDMYFESATHKMHLLGN